MKKIRFGLLGALTALASSLAADPQTAPAHDHGISLPVTAKLVQTVRENTREYLFAPPDGYGPMFGCVTGPDHGAMGVHYINGALVSDGEIDAAHPEALIYEPHGTHMRLVGVEYIVDAKTWLAAHDNIPPMLEGQAFQLVGSPNRYGLPPFFELHVWAWRDNPQGAFVDWNNHVTCEKQ